MLKTADGSISGSLKVIESLKGKKKGKKGKSQDGAEWTWKEQVDLVKYSTVPIEQSLLRLENELSALAVECFLCLMRYMGDQPLPPDMSEVKCVYTILMVREPFLSPSFLRFNRSYCGPTVSGPRYRYNVISLSASALPQV